MESKYKYRVEIQQVMFVSGVTTDPPLQTVMVVEDIVRSQVVELMNRGTALARRRGSKAISVEDIMFLIRHDVAKVNRLSTYLAWKDVRKNAREQDNGANGTTDGQDILEDPAAALASQDKRQMKGRRIGLPWKTQNMFPIPMNAVSGLPVPTSHSGNVGQGSGGGQDEEAEGDDSDAEDSEAMQIMNERLRLADLRTRNMTKEEYVHWSECRQASFTFRKAKRFKDWAGVAHITDSRLQDDIMDVLGFLTFEIVVNLTTAALEVKAQMDSKTKRAEPHKPQTGNLFRQRSEDDTTLLPEHVRVAYARFERPLKKESALLLKSGARGRYPLRFI